MALYAFDGTGNEDRDGDDRDSNVLDFFRAYDDALKDNDPDDLRGSLYVKGIGKMARTFFGDKLAEAFGIGGHRRIRQAMRRLRNNVRAGDRAIDVVGFSRGAGIAVSFANEIAEEHPELEIRFMGLWDIVGQFGLPGERLQAGHDLACPRNVRRCYHAMALDENRALFPLTRLVRNDKPVEGFTEVWFRGVHSDVGGGNGNRGLNWVSLHWMFMNARREGLPIDGSAIETNLADRGLPQQISDHDLDLEKLRSFFPNDCLHESVVLSPGVPGRPHNNPRIALRRITDDGSFVEQASV
jgi:uncharacterized protein (DUF2235 family)